MSKKKSRNQRSLPILSPEQVYNHLKNKEWLNLIELLHTYGRKISSDCALEASFKTAESEIIRNLNELEEDENFEYMLKKIYLAHETKLYSFSEANFYKILVKLTRLYNNKSDIKNAYYYASQNSQDDFCREIIEIYNRSLPKDVWHSQNEQISVTENNNISANSHVISLFKSAQEHDFFMAIRENFQSFIVYPNVALSSLIDFDAIKLRLSSDERDYFLKAIVDCVVFDQHNKYMPIYFFELDSSMHDNDKQLKRDRMKDNILSVAGQKLYRIRKLSSSQGQKEFGKLIREVILS